MLRIEEGSAFLLKVTRRSGYHVDLYVYDLYLRLRARLAELAPFDKILCIDAKAIFPPSFVQLQASVLGLRLTAEKDGASMRLQLQLPEPNPQIASLLTDWGAEGELSLGRSVLPDSAEAAVLDCAAFLRTTTPNAAACSPTGESAAPREGLS